MVKVLDIPYLIKELNTNLQFSQPLLREEYGGKFLSKEYRLLLLGEEYKLDAFIIK